MEKENLLPTAFTYPKDIVAFHSRLVEEAKGELAEFQAMNDKLSESPPESKELQKLQVKVAKHIVFLQKRLTALENAFLPIPRFDYTRFRFSVEKLPSQIAARMVEAKQLGVFTEVGLIEGRRKPTTRRDPLLIGIIKEGHREEHFLIGWWR